MVAFVNPATTLGATGMAGGIKRITPLMDDAAVLAMRNRGAATRRGQQAIPTPPIGGAPSGPRRSISPVDMALGGAERITGIAGMLPFAAMPLGLLGGGIGWAGKKTKLGSLEKAGGALSAPGQYLAKPLGETALAGPVGAVGNFLAGGTARIAGGASKITGLDKWMHGRHAANAERYFAQAKTALGNIPMSEAPAALRPHLREMQSIVGSASLTPTQAARLEHLIEAGAEHSKGATKAFKKPFKALTGNLGKAASHHNSAAYWKDVDKGIRDIPERINKAEAGNAIMNTAFAAGSAVSMASDARTFGQNIASLKEMYRDLTGNSISTVGLLTGRVPKVIGEARSKLVKTLFVKEAADAASMGISLKELLNPHFNGSMKAIVGFMGASMIGESAAGIIGETPIAAYQSMKDAFRAPGQKPAEFYAQFLGELSGDLKKRGGAQSPFTQEMAKQYAAMQATPEQILKEIESGQLMKRVEGVIAANKAQAPAQAATAATPKERPVMGKHTQNVVQREAMTQNPSAPGHAVT